MKYIVKNNKYSESNLLEHILYNRDVKTLE